MRGRRPHGEVVERLKLELVQEPNCLPLRLTEGLRGADVPLVGAFEIAMGKWQALSTWLAGRRYTRGDYVRHPMDLAAMSAAPGFERESLRGARSLLVAERSGPGITHALRELQAPEWETNYEDHLRRMGQLPVRYRRSAWSYSRWHPVRRRAARMALELDLVPVRDRREVERTARPRRGRGGQGLSR